MASGSKHNREEAVTRGFSTPYSATGRSATAPNPPWHYVGDYLAVEFMARPEAVQALLPPGFELGEEPGRCAVFFSDCQYATDGSDELREPAVTQYKECLVVAAASYEGKPAAFMPFIFVDNDNSMVRGLIQGMPKQLASVKITRAFDIDSPATARIAPGGLFAGSLTHRDHRLLSARVTLREPTDQAPNRMMARLINRRHFPDLASGRHGLPLVDQLVRQRTRDVRIANIWKGEAELEMFEAPTHELGTLKPVSVGAGYRYTFAMTIDDVQVVADLAAGRP
jgi:acetoacetate decarboxylase